MVDDLCRFAMFTIHTSASIWCIHRSRGDNSLEAVRIGEATPVVDCSYLRLEAGQKGVFITEKIINSDDTAIAIEFRVN